MSLPEFFFFFAELIKASCHQGCIIADNVAATTSCLGTGASMEQLRIFNLFLNVNTMSFIPQQFRLVKTLEFKSITTNHAIYFL